MSHEDGILTVNLNLVPNPAYVAQVYFYALAESIIILVSLNYGVYQSIYEWPVFDRG